MRSACVTSLPWRGEAVLSTPKWNIQDQLLSLRLSMTYLTRNKLWNTGHHSNHQLDMNSSLLLPLPPRNAQRIMGRTPAANHSLLLLNSASVVNSPLDKRLM
ncbi:hypothetical protein Pcinc_023550 [Petrolisthes cinctipes]|uniref:Uncharacterized protein n=1 Tax=Petrolisthes cinctipes TaxID=88211 RepID=A0AAE1ESP5_PETCI|nr:hypothetical protein Pcinc_033208 [Petrolisthes cinctipes]KAK3871300.1 hypothetical protein Pcinc_023550 [Petrolisthes cinctipes]